MPQRSPLSWHASTAWLTAAVLIPPIGLLLAWAATGGEPAVPQMELVLQAVALLVAGQLLLAASAAAAESPLAAPLAAFYVGAVCLVLLWPTVPEPVLAVRLSLAVAVLAFFYTGCTRLLGTLLGCIPVAGIWVLFAAVLSGAAPVWAGPLLDLPGSWRGLADPLLSASPFTYLATMADWDFLRHDWFYHHTPLGGLRFRYPDPATAGAVYMGLALLCHGLAELIRWRRRTDKLNSIPLNQVEGAS